MRTKKIKEKSELALKLKALRKDKGVTSDEVAEALGLKSSTYRRYEIDTNPKPDTYLALAEYFGVPVEYLMNGESSDDVLQLSNESKYNAVEGELGKLSEIETMFIKKLRSISGEDLIDVSEYLNSKKDIK